MEIILLLCMQQNQIFRVCCVASGVFVNPAGGRPAFLHIQLDREKPDKGNKDEYTVSKYLEINDLIYNNLHKQAKHRAACRSWSLHNTCDFMIQSFTLLHKSIRV